MPHANFGKLFTLKITPLVVDLLSDNPNKSLEQLVNDVYVLERQDKNHILNTVNLFIDLGVVNYLDGSVSLSSEILTAKNPVQETQNKMTRAILSPFHMPNVIPAVSQDTHIGLYIDGLCISQKYFTYLHVLYFLGIVNKPINSKLWPISQKYSHLFINQMKYLLEKPWEDQKSLSEDELRVKLESQATAGKKAEEWILNRENERLKSHPYRDKIIRVSAENVGAGYDIASFKNLNSFKYDRFIEVKSYSGDTEFFISSNEIDKAKELGPNYYLILVDREKIADKGYIPREICNPYIFLMTDQCPAEFKVEINGWKVKVN